MTILDSNLQALKNLDDPQNEAQRKREAEQREKIRKFFIKYAPALVEFVAILERATSRNQPL